MNTTLKTCMYHHHFLKGYWQSHQILEVSRLFLYHSSSRYEFLTLYTCPQALEKEKDCFTHLLVQQTFECLLYYFRIIKQNAVIQLLHLIQIFVRPLAQMFALPLFLLQWIWLRVYLDYLVNTWKRTHQKVEKLYRFSSSVFLWINSI